MSKKNLQLAVLVLAAVYVVATRTGLISDRPSQTDRASVDVLTARGEFPESGSQIEGNGVVIRVLPDDNVGSRHQRFIVRLDSGRTLLIAHNIDLASRVEPLEKGDRLEFAGEYEWNEKGGVVHWTHHDPAGRHPGGWIRRNGKTYR